MGHGVKKSFKSRIKPTGSCWPSLERGKIIWELEGKRGRKRGGKQSGEHTRECRDEKAAGGRAYERCAQSWFPSLASCCRMQRGWGRGRIQHTAAPARADPGAHRCTCTPFTSAPPKVSNQVPGRGTSISSPAVVFMAPCHLPDPFRTLQSSGLNDPSPLPSALMNQLSALLPGTQL